MFRQILESIEGIGIFPMISLLIFTVFFALVIIWVINLDKKRITHLENLPFDDSNDQLTGDQNG